MCSRACCFMPYRGNITGGKPAIAALCITEPFSPEVHLPLLLYASCIIEPFILEVHLLLLFYALSSIDTGGTPAVAAPSHEIVGMSTIHDIVLVPKIVPKIDAYDDNGSFGHV